MATLSEQRPVVPSTRERGMDTGMAARYVNIIAGAWLFISAFLWRHSEVSRNNTWIVGALTVIFAVIALRTPMMRFVNTALAVWLFFSTLGFFRVSGATLVNNVIVAAVIFIASLVPSGAMISGQRPRRYVQS